jgi:hypothetical protein
MKILHSACACALLAALMVGGTYAQTAAQISPSQVSTFSNRTVGAGPQFHNQQKTPLVTIGNLAIGIWSPVPPPYDVAANRNLAANPIPP